MYDVYQYSNRWTYDHILICFFRDETTISCYKIPNFFKKLGQRVKKEQLLTVLSKKTLRRSLHQHHHGNRAFRIEHIVFALRHRRR